MSEQSIDAISDLFYHVLDQRATSHAVRVLKMRLRELGMKHRDEMLLFGELQRACLSDLALDEAFVEAGLGSISAIDRLAMAPETGALVQGFSQMVADRWSDGAFRADKSVPEMATAGRALNVWVQGGRNLVVRDLKTSDPYCVITYGKPRMPKLQEFRTTVCPNTLNPKWPDELMQFQRVTKAGFITIEVFDKDTIGDDDYMGQVTIHVAALNPDARTEGWFELKGVDTGELRVRFDFVPDTGQA